MSTARVVAAAGIAALLLPAASAPARAATQNLTYDCYQNAPVTLAVAPGDVLSFASNCGAAPGARAVNASLFTSYPTTFSSWPQTFMVSPGLSQGTDAAAFEMYGASTTVYTLVYGASSPEPAPASSPPDWVQAYGRAPGDACLTGWQPSWAQWPNDGGGGFVCERTISWQGDEPGGT